MTKLSKLIIQYKVEDGYAVAYTVEKIAQFLRCSQDEVLSAALNDEKAAQFIFNSVKNLKNSK